MAIQAPDRPQIEVPPNVAEIHDFLPEIGGYLVTLKDQTKGSIDIPLGQTVANPYRFTSDRDDKILDILKKSLAKGQTLPVDAAPILKLDGEIVFLMVDGEKRRLTLQSIGQNSIKCRILQVKSKKDLLVEQFLANKLNTGNYAMNAFTKATALKQLVETEEAEGNTNPLSTIAAATHTMKETVRNYLSILKAPTEIQDLIRTKALTVTDFFKITGQDEKLEDFNLARALQYLLERYVYSKFLKPIDISEAIIAGGISEDKTGRPRKKLHQNPAKTPADIAQTKKQIAEGQTTLLEYIRTNTGILDKEVEIQVIECLAEPDKDGKITPLTLNEIFDLTDIPLRGPQGRKNAIAHVLNNPSGKIALLGLTIKKITRVDNGSNSYELVWQSQSETEKP